MIVTARKPEVEASAGRPRVGAALVRLTPPPAREGRALAGTMIKAGDFLSSSCARPGPIPLNQRI